MSTDDKDEHFLKKLLEPLSRINNSSWERKLKIFRFAEKHGYHILKPGFYSPITSLKDLTDDVFAKEYKNMDWNVEAQLNLLQELKAFSGEFNDIVKKNLFDMSNQAFALHDAPVYYGIIRKFKPKKIIEIGAGHSTVLASYAVQKNENTIITAVDPFLSGETKEMVTKAKIEFIEKPVQELPLSFFEELSENDILFIDSSHVSKVGSDVNFLYLEVLPILKPGVLIHVHDIFLPHEYPRTWLEQKLLFWNEQYLLNAFLINNKNFEALIGNYFLHLKYHEKLKDFCDTNMVPGGCSFWMKKIS